MVEDLVKVDYENDRQTVLGRDLHDFLNVGKDYTTWVKDWMQYDFTQGADFITFYVDKNGDSYFKGIQGFDKIESLSGVEKARSGYTTNHQISIDCAKEICMLARTEKGKQARQYFIELEKKWNSPESVMARALKMANNKLMSLKSTVTILETENKLLSCQTLTWTNRKVLEAIIKAYGSHIDKNKSNPSVNGFQEAWREFKKELLYAHGINLNLRITNYLNDTGKKTKPKTMDMIHDDELQACIGTAVSLCRIKDVDISDIIDKYSKSA